jgi:hypothetical protein
MRKVIDLLDDEQREALIEVVDFEALASCRRCCHGRHRPWFTTSRVRIGVSRQASGHVSASCSIQTDARSARYNPLLEVRKGAAEARDVQNIADILIDPEARSSAAPIGKRPAMRCSSA